MVKTIKADLLDTDVDVIAHQVNCKGVMGAGLAKQLRGKFDNLFPEYKKFCKENKELLGKCQLVKVSEDQYVANLFGQDDYGYNKKHTVYPALYRALKELKEIAMTEGFQTVGVPYGLGCGLAGGEWSTVSNILKLVFGDKESGVKLVICKL